LLGRRYNLCVSYSSHFALILGSFQNVMRMKKSSVKRHELVHREGSDTIEAIYNKDKSLQWLLELWCQWSLTTGHQG
jgi:hypothetical protein